MYYNTRPSYTQNKKLTVVNFFGGPGVGKSTTAAEAFALMKKQNYKVELVHEVAKDFVWEQWDHIFGEQDYIFAHQHRLIRRLVAHDIDYAIVDSSILLSLFYMPYDFPPSFTQFVEDVFFSYDNINIILDRNDSIPYVQAGRNENTAQAEQKDKMIIDYFERHNIPHWRIMAGSTAVNSAFNVIKEHKKAYTPPQ